MCEKLKLDYGKKNMRDIVTGLMLVLFIVLLQWLCFLRVYFDYCKHKDDYYCIENCDISSLMPSNN